jgi:hypothetical protein
MTEHMTFNFSYNQKFEVKRRLSSSTCKHHQELFTLID